MISIIRRLGLLSDAEGSSLVLPLVYDLTNNVTQLAERRDATAGNPGGLGPVAHTASMMLKRFAECSHMMGLQPGECSIFPAVRDLLANLTCPNEPPSMVVNVNAPNPGMQQANNMVPMGLGSGPGMGPGTPINAMQMQPMNVGGVQGVSMPIHSPFGQPMSSNSMAPAMSMGQSINNIGQPGNMQM